MKALIIDDDPGSHKVLKNLLQSELPQVEVIASGYTLEEGRELIFENSPELVFLDIELGDTKGFELLSMTPGFEYHVIFITAHNKYAVEAFRFGAVDFLEKPILREELVDAVKKVTDLEKLKISQKQLEVLLENYEKAQKEQLMSVLVVVNQTDINFLKIEEIIRMEASTVYTLIFAKSWDQPVVSSINIGKYVKQFEPYPHIVQVHRSHMINLNFVKKYNRSERRILMDDGSEISIAKAHVEEFLEAMEAL